MNAAPKPRQLNEEMTRLRTVSRQFIAVQRIRKSLANQIGAAARRELFDQETVDRFTQTFVEPWQDVEDEYAKAAGKLVRKLPIWRKYLQFVNGIADRLGAKLVGEIGDIGHFDTISKLWAFSGYRVMDDGRAQRREAGKKSNWNATLKETCYLIGEQFVRSGAETERHGPSFGRLLYDRAKKADREKHPVPVPRLDKKGQPAKDRDGKSINDYSDGHIHARAKRKAVKIFLGCLWLAWREIENLPLREPWPLEHGHTTLITPWQWVEHDRKLGETE